MLAPATSTILCFTAREMPQVPCEWNGGRIVVIVQQMICLEKNGSDHAVVASYFVLYEECEVEISTVFGPILLTLTANL